MIQQKTKRNSAELEREFLTMQDIIQDLPKKLDGSEQPTKVLFITTYPPRECGIATYSTDLLHAIGSKFPQSMELVVCALESDTEQHTYNDADNIYTTLNTDQSSAYTRLAHKINTDHAIGIVLVQHEFGLFKNGQADFVKFLNTVVKPVVISFHTVLPNPNPTLKENVINITAAAKVMTVMTQSSAAILMRDYGLAQEKIAVIPHGTHLVKHSAREALKKKYGLENKKILSTFGLLGPGKSIETTLDALPAIIKPQPDALFLIIGKTHPTLKNREGEKYRDFLKDKIAELKLEDHVRFIDEFVELPTLLEYLQLSDIYLFTSKDPNQAVSGTFSYAMSCGCPIISTPIPHAKEVLKQDTGILIDFSSPQQLASAVVRLLDDNKLRSEMGHNCLLYSASTAWDNAAIAYARLFKKISKLPIKLKYNKPEFNLVHIKKMTTDFGLLQFSVINQPDPASGYTLDDNARALIALCRHYHVTRDSADLNLIKIYLDFVSYCYQGKEGFYNYVDIDKEFTPQNAEVNLEDANGRAIWALGYFLSIAHFLPEAYTPMVQKTEKLFQNTLSDMSGFCSTRAMAFIIKGLYYYDQSGTKPENIFMIKTMADRMVQMYRHESSADWQWFEGYFTYGNSAMPEALLLAYRATGCEVYKTIAKKSFDFLLTQIFTKETLKLIPNQSWLLRSEALNGKSTVGGEQPIDVAYTILALKKFDEEFPMAGYDKKMLIAFNWFLGKNHLHQIVYNPCTGGCYDGLEDHYVNLNQGAESTLSYLLSRLAMFPDGEMLTAVSEEDRKLKNRSRTENELVKNMR